MEGRSDLAANLEAVKDKSASKSSNKKRKTEEKQEAAAELDESMEVVEGGEDIGANPISGIFDDEEVVVPREKERKEKKNERQKGQERQEGQKRQKRKEETKGRRSRIDLTSMENVSKQCACQKQKTIKSSLRWFGGRLSKSWLDKRITSGQDP